MFVDITSNNIFSNFVFTSPGTSGVLGLTGRLRDIHLVRQLILTLRQYPQRQCPEPIFSHCQRDHRCCHCHEAEALCTLALTASQSFAYLEVNTRDIMMFSASGGLHPVSGWPERKPFTASCQIWVLFLFFCGACLLGDTVVAQQCLVLVSVLASRGMRVRI